MNVSQAKVIAEAMETKLQELEEDFGIKIIRHNGRISANSLTIKFEAAKVSEDGNVETHEFSVLKRQYPDYAYDWFWHDKHGPIKFTGVNSRARRYPIEFQTRAGKNYKADTTIFTRVEPMHKKGAA
jgi:hypothetical protein